MKRLSIGTISALFLAGAVSPAVVAATGESLTPESSTQSQSVSQLPGSPQVPGAGQNPGPTTNPSPGAGQTPGQMQTPGPGSGQTPGQRQTPGQTQTPGTMQTPSAEWPGQDSSANIPRDAVSPFQLANMAIGGNLDSEEFGGPNSVLVDMRRGKPLGRDIVEAAIQEGYLSRDLMEDSGYIDQVNQVLRMKARDFRN